PDTPGLTDLGEVGLLGQLAAVGLLRVFPVALRVDEAGIVGPLGSGLDRGGHLVPTPAAGTFSRRAAISSGAELVPTVKRCPSWLWVPAHFLRLTWVTSPMNLFVMS